MLGYEQKEFNTGNLHITSNIPIRPGSIRLGSTSFINGSGTFSSAMAMGGSGLIFISGPDFRIGSGEFSLAAWVNTLTDATTNMRIFESAVRLPIGKLYSLTLLALTIFHHSSILPIRYFYISGIKYWSITCGISNSCCHFTSPSKGKLYHCSLL